MSFLDAFDSARERIVALALTVGGAVVSLLTLCVTACVVVRTLYPHGLAG